MTLIRIFACWCFICAVAAPLANVAADVLPFFDDFDGDVTQVGREPVQWIQRGSSPTSVMSSSGGNLFLENNGGDTSAVVFETTDDGAVGNVSLRTQLQFLQVGDGTAFASIFARGGNEGGGLYWGGIVAQNTGALLLAGRVGADGVSSTLAQQDTSLDPITGDVVLQMDVVGSEISVSAFEVGGVEPVATIGFTDTLFATGSIGLFINGSSGATREVAFRYFEAVPEPSCMLILLVAAACCFRGRMFRM